MAQLPLARNHLQTRSPSGDYVICVWSLSVRLNFTRTKPALDLVFRLHYTQAVFFTDSSSSSWSYFYLTFQGCP